jgi:iron complex outermembrane recepter protein
MMQKGYVAFASVLFYVGTVCQVLYSQTCPEGGKRASVDGYIRLTQTAYSRADSRLYSGENARITLYDSKLDSTTTTSNSTGYYVFPAVCPGNYRLTFHFIGFASQKLTLTIGLNEGAAHRDVILLPEEHELDQVEIAGTRRAALHAANATEIASIQLDATQGQSLGEILARIPGITTLQTGATIVKPVLQGLHSNRLLILQNGIRQEGQQWGTDHAPELDPMANGTLQVVRGAATVRYGADALGGAIIAGSAPLPDSGIHGKVNLAGASNNRMGAASGQLSGAPGWFPGFAFRVQGTLRKAGDSRTPTYRLSNTGLSETHGSFQVGYKRSNFNSVFSYAQYNAQTGILFSSHTGNAGDLASAVSRGRPAQVFPFTYSIASPSQRAIHEQLALTSSYKFSPKSSIFLTLGRQFNVRSEYDRRLGATTVEAAQIPALVFFLTTYSADAHTTYRLSEHSAIESGISYYHSLKEGNFDATTSRFLLRSLIPNFTSTLLSAWAIWKAERGPYQYEIGARYERKSYALANGARPGQPNQRSFSLPSVTASATLPVTQHFSLEGELSSSARPPSIAELYSRGFHHGTAAVEIGNPNARTERMHAATLNAIWQGHTFTFKASGFVKYFDNYLNLVAMPPPAQTVSGYFQVFSYQQTPALLNGIDVEATLQLTPTLDLSLVGSTVWASNPATSGWILNFPADRLRLSPRYQFKMIGILKNLSIRTDLSLVTRQYRLPKNLVSDTLDYAPAPPAYALLSLEANAELGAPFPPGTSLSIAAYNMLNSRYRDYQDRFRYFADAPGSNLVFRLTLPFSI